MKTAYPDPPTIGLQESAAIKRSMDTQSYLCLYFWLGISDQKCDIPACLANIIYSFTISLSFTISSSFYFLFFCFFRFPFICLFFITAIGFDSISCAWLNRHSLWGIPQGSICMLFFKVCIVRALFTFCFWVVKVSVGNFGSQWQHGSCLQSLWKHS